MASPFIQSIIDDDTPLSVRRKRRSSSALSYSRSNSQSAAQISHGISTPPATPKRSKKRVRFSDPGPEIDDDNESTSSGLTPFIRRTCLVTPKSSSKRRHSTPSTRSNRAEYQADDTPICGTLQFAPLRQVLEGRVKRRLKRNRLSEEVNFIESEKRLEARERRSEVERLRQELASKDAEVQSLRDEQEIASQIEGGSGGTIITNATQSTRVQELEQEVRDLKAELERKEEDSRDDPNWTMAARDPFDFQDEDENMITNYDIDEFQDSEMVTTPTRLNTSFPSPPSTMPNTPCKSICSISAGIQAELSDPEKEQMKSQLRTLQSEISNLTSSIAFNEDHQARLAGKLSDFISTDESMDHSTLDAALDTVLTQLALSQSSVLESTAAFDALSKEVSTLGFPASSVDEALSLIASQFRQARLDLEYLTPGEVIEGFENSKLLEMLVSRLKVLVEKMKSQDESIDQYHEQELLLRQQIDTRVTVMDNLRRDLAVANAVVGDLRKEIEEKEVGNERLVKALESYREEVKGLEVLIERVERESQITEECLRSEVGDLERRLGDEVMAHDLTKADNEGKSLLLAELEKRLVAAQQSSAKIKEELAANFMSNDVLITDRDATIETLKTAAQDRERVHGKALALRDARVTELRGEVERVNDALKTAHSTILSLRKESSELTAQIEGEKKRSKFVIESMQSQLQRTMETASGYVNGAVAVQGPSSERVGREVQSDGEGVRRDPPTQRRLLDAGLARRSSGKGKKRRRYDSGLGFLEEEDEGDMSIDV